VTCRETDTRELQIAEERDCECSRCGDVHTGDWPRREELRQEALRTIRAGAIVLRARVVELEKSEREANHRCNVAWRDRAEFEKRAKDSDTHVLMLREQLAYANARVTEAVAAEREACAKIAEGACVEWYGPHTGGVEGVEIAKAIRARGAK
jgi:hypothetical protein